MLQRRIEHRFLNMYTDPKCIGPPIARIEVHCLSTLPWEREPINTGNKGWSIDKTIILPTWLFNFFPSVLRSEVEFKFERKKRFETSVLLFIPVTTLWSNFY